MRRVLYAALLLYTGCATYPFEVSASMQKPDVVPHPEDVVPPGMPAGTPPSPISISMIEGPVVYIELTHGQRKELYVLVGRLTQINSEWAAISEAPWILLTPQKGFSRSQVVTVVVDSDRMEYGENIGSFYIYIGTVKTLFTIKAVVREIDP